MFTLRKTSKEKGDQNIYLGDSYTVIYSERNKERFNRILSEMKDPHPESTTPYAYVIDDNDRLHGLYRGFGNYVVSPTGSTYERL